MNLSLSNMLSSTASGLDPDAKGYIDAVVAAGATVSGGQKSAINTFFKTGKSDGWYSSLKRLYLPIWASAAPNAIDMIGRTSGTFNGTVTHAAGFAQGNGSTGYFDTGISANSLPLTNANGGLGVLVKQAPTSSHTHSGAIQSNGQYLAILSTATQYRTVPFTSTRQQLVTASFADMDGVLFLDRDGGDDVYYQRKLTGLTEIVRTTQAVGGLVPTINQFFMALNNSGTPQVFSNAEYGAFFITADCGNASGFTLALKNLWETCTGLVLP